MKKTIKVLDFFSGCGGTSAGFAQSGLDVSFALEIDTDAAGSFAANFPNAKVLCNDIRKTKASALNDILKDENTLTLFCGCAPCQPFSRQNGNKRRDDPRQDLLSHFGRFVKYWRPDYVFVENVPGLQRLPDKDSPLFMFESLLRRLGYEYQVGVLPALWFGVPQTRERLVLLATKNGTIQLPKAKFGEGTAHPRFSTVRDWIADLPPIEAGETCQSDHEHQASALSSLNLRRIAVTPEGGGRESWARSLWLPCHKDHVGHSDVYGRLSWDLPASGLTTRCISYSNGRFGHPEQNRAISIREAACLQTFPMSYRFTGSLTSRARQIGNAVPPMMAKAIGDCILDHARHLH
jgi:DNA (cytosine-5)-methyltransferase 1